MGEVKSWFHSFLTSVVDGVEWVTSGPLRAGSGPGKKFFIGLPSKGGAATNLHTKWQRSTPSCRVTRAWCERVNCVQSADNDTAEKYKNSNMVGHRDPLRTARPREYYWPPPASRRHWLTSAPVGWGLEDGLDTSQKRKKNLLPLLELEPRTIQPVACTDWAIQATREL